MIDLSRSGVMKSELITQKLRMNVSRKGQKGGILRNWLLLLFAAKGTLGQTGMLEIMVTSTHVYPLVETVAVADLRDLIVLPKKGQEHGRNLQHLLSRPAAARYRCVPSHDRAAVRRA
jgi:hypothetical protein